MTECFQRRDGILQAGLVLNLEADGLFARIAFGIAQRMPAIVGAQIKVLPAALGDLEAEASSGKVLGPFQVGRTEADVADIPKLDHVLLKPGGTFTVMRAAATAGG
jgi:hypothetical protein